MIEALEQLISLAQAGLAAGFLVFLRVGAAMTLLPAFGENSVPQRVRLGLALAFTIALVPLVTPDLPAIGRVSPLIGLFIATEVIVGLTMGLMVRLFIMSLQIAGSMAAQSTSLSQIFAGAGVEPQPAIGHLLVVSGLALAAMLGLHVKIVTLFLMSYEMFPVGQFPDRSVLTDWGILRIAHAFAVAFSLAAPFVIASLIYNVALGVINKAMPQLMVAFVGAPAITAGGLILLLVSAPLLLSVWVHGLERFFETPFAVPE